MIWAWRGEIGHVRTCKFVYGIYSAARVPVMVDEKFGSYTTTNYIARYILQNLVPVNPEGVFQRIVTRPPSFLLKFSATAQWIIIQLQYF